MLWFKKNEEEKPEPERWTLMLSILMKSGKWHSIATWWNDGVKPSRNWQWRPFLAWFAASGDDSTEVYILRHKKGYIAVKRSEIASVSVYVEKAERGRPIP